MSGLSFPLSAIKQGNLPGILLAGWGQITSASITSITSWDNGKVLVIQFTPAIASVDVVGDEHILGPLYIRDGYLVANDGVSDPPSLCAATWAAGETVTAIVETTSSGKMRVGRRLS